MGRKFLINLALIFAFLFVLVMHAIPLALPLLIVMAWNGSGLWFLLLLVYIPVIAFDASVVETVLE